MRDHVIQTCILNLVLYVHIFAMSAKNRVGGGWGGGQGLSGHVILE